MAVDANALGEEVPAPCPVLLKLFAYAFYYQKNRKSFALGLLAFGVIWGGLIDWPTLYFTLTLLGVEVGAWIRGQASSRRLMLVLALCGFGIFVFDLWHMAFATGSLGSLRNIVSVHHLFPKEKLHPLKFVLINLEMNRRYYSHMGLLSSLLVATGIVWRTRWRESVFQGQPVLLRRLLWVCLVSGGGYLFCIMRYSFSHHYSQFYLYPFVIFSTILIWKKIANLSHANSCWLRLVPALFWLDIFATSYYTLYFRHTHPLGYAMELTQEHRTTSFIPYDPK